MKGSARIEVGRTWIQLAIIFFICVGLLFVGACSKKKIRSDYPSLERSGDQAGKGSETQGTMGQDGSGSGAGISEKGLGGDQAGNQGAELSSAANAAREKFEKDDIYFQFDSAALLPEAQSVLMEKSEWMRNHPQSNVVIEGHTDERGTIAYNLALGDRRAESVRAFLMELGVDSSRIRTISYGEENPMDPDTSETAWAKNRRAHFFVEE